MNALITAPFVFCCRLRPLCLLIVNISLLGLAACAVIDPAHPIGFTPLPAPALAAGVLRVADDLTIVTIDPTIMMLVTQGLPCGPIATSRRRLAGCHARTGSHYTIWNDGTPESLGHELAHYCVSVTPARCRAVLLAVWQMAR